MMHNSEIVDDNMVVEGYEEIAVDDMNDMSELVVTNDDEETMQYEEDHDDQGYGGMPLDQYNDIVEYKRNSVVPQSVDRRHDRSAPSHWRARCKCFSMADDGETLLYYNPDNAQNTVPKVVVKKGEVRRVLERIHELIGHLGQKRTQMVVLRKLYWRSVRQDVKTFIASCVFCAEKKLQGRKIVKAPVDITSDNFDISVLVRDTASSSGERLEFHLVGYNEAEVKEAAYTRMTSYTFKETANEYRTRYTTAPQPQTPVFRRQPYVKKHNNQSVGYLVPFQQRSRTMEPEFIEMFGRDVYPHSDMMYDTVVPEMDDGIMRSREATEQAKRKENELPEAQPITLLGNLLQAKNFKVEEGEEDDPQAAGPSDKSPVSSQRYPQKRSMNVPPHRENRDAYLQRGDPGAQRAAAASPQPTTTAGLIKKRRRELPSIRGMANRFSMAIGESDRIDNTEVNRSNPHLIEYSDPSTMLRGDPLGLPPVIMAPSTNDEVCKLQIEALRRHIHMQKMQEKMMQEQYDRSYRIPITRYIQHEEEVQDEPLDVEDHGLDVIDGHPVYEDEEEEQIHH